MLHDYMMGDVWPPSKLKNHAVVGVSESINRPRERMSIVCPGTAAYVHVHMKLCVHVLKGACTGDGI